MITDEEISRQNAIWENWIDAIEEEIGSRGNGLTEWEVNFIESVRNQFDKKKAFGKLGLSDKQAEIVERIYAEKTR